MWLSALLALRGVTFSGMGDRRSGEAAIVAWMERSEIQGRPIRIKVPPKLVIGRRTVLVPPARRVVVAFDANNSRPWALHCHLLYHLEAAMFTTLYYV